MSYFYTGIITEFCCISWITGARRNRQVVYVTGRAPREHYIGSYYFLTALNKGFVKPNWWFPRSTFISYVCICMMYVYMASMIFLSLQFLQYVTRLQTKSVFILDPYLMIDIWLDVDSRRTIWLWLDFKLYTLSFLFRDISWIFYINCKILSYIYYFSINFINCNVLLKNEQRCK